MPIDEFNECFNTKLDMNDVDSMAGYLITALGTIPEENEKLTYEVDNLTLTSEEMEGSRVLQIRVKFHPEEEVDEEEKEKKFFSKNEETE